MLKGIKTSMTMPVKCKWSTKEAPAKAIKICRELYLDKEIEKFKGEKILTLGNISAHSIRGRKRRIKDLIAHPEYLHNKLVLSVWHPTIYVVSGFRQYLIDIKRAIRWLLRPS
jgi:uracil-DNA glycosylase